MLKDRVRTLDELLAENKFMREALEKIAKIKGSNDIYSSETCLSVSQEAKSVLFKLGGLENTQGVQQEATNDIKGEPKEGVSDEEL